jgi:hypothetical protein
VSQAWRDVSVFPYTLTYSQRHYCKGQFHPCNWCGGDAVLVVCRTSNFSDRSYEDYACERCAKPWQEAAKKETKKG